VVTVISDNYFGYCKKEVKTQLSMAANLFGNTEEEHAGGALIFPSYDLAEQIAAKDLPLDMPRGFAEAMELLQEGPPSLLREPVYFYNLGCYHAVLGTPEEAQN
jgi:hypothetical protein